MSGRIEGKVALVTGAATGIGAAVARRFAAEGARLVLFGLGEGQLEAVARETAGVAAHGDVTREADARQAVATAQRRHGGLDILVHAAGVIVVDDPLTIEEQGWSRALEVNLGGAMRINRAALAALIARGGGAIVNIASVAAFNSGPGMASYAASKAGVVSLTRSIAYAHGKDKIRANCLCPGWVRTPMSDAEMDLAAGEKGTDRESEFRALAERLALRRVAVPEEMAACCLFLASDEASFVTGAVLVADGGGRVPAHARAV